jgi:hypothetical protein
VAGIDRLAGSGASLEQLGERRPGVVLREFGSPVGVILAAGTGSRLGVGSKALARLAGITLLERAVATLRAVGIAEIVVVGYEKERLREFVRKHGLGVQLVENGDFGLGNGSWGRAGTPSSAAGWEKAARSRPSTSRVSSGSTSTPRPTGDAPSARSSPWPPVRGAVHRCGWSV